MFRVIQGYMLRGRTSRGVRGLKSVSVIDKPYRHRRTSRGVRGLKLHKRKRNFFIIRRTSRGVRGLKSNATIMTTSIFSSHLSRGAWIEIHSTTRAPFALTCRTSRGVRGLKSLAIWEHPFQLKSHLSRGAWIEMFMAATIVINSFVAPLAGCVD